MTLTLVFLAGVIVGLFVRGLCIAAKDEHDPEDLPKVRSWVNEREVGSEPY